MFGPASGRLRAPETSRDRPPHPSEFAMPAVADATLLLAPSRLVAETRVDFRCAALDSLERAGEHGAPLLSIDMTETRDVDASGLGILVLVQKRARERGLTTRLMNTQHNVRSLLALTKLEALFEFA